ncbi:MAG TPA: hypothetical protein VK837_00170 [Longimicrobiales bacterium]|nr:hypothetical protein [Longimicrobiales bacterium]
MQQAFRHTAIALALVGSALSGACADDSGALAPEFAGDGPAFAKPAPVDISGDWNWNERSRFILSVEAAAIFGVTPEGPNTVLDCESGGTLTLDQNGATFTGFATQSSSCETKGGVAVVPPVLPPALDVVDGQIMGRRISFVFGAGPIPCPYTASMTTVGGVATSLSGTGRCIGPGHPQSVLPVPPPPLAPGSTIEWNAWR